MRSFTVLGDRLKLVGVGAAVAGNTGNGTITAAPTVSAAAKFGAYTARCTAVAANGGTFDVLDPFGHSLGSATVGIAFAGEITFTISDGTIDFAVDDSFTITTSYQLAPGSTIANTAVGIARIRTRGLRSVRICAKVTGAGATLKAYRIRPDGLTRSTIGNPVNVALADGVENKMDITLTGEDYVELEVLAGGDLTVSFVDVSGIEGV